MPTVALTSAESSVFDAAFAYANVIASVHDLALPTEPGSVVAARTALVEALDRYIPELVDSFGEDEEPDVLVEAIAHEVRVVMLDTALAQLSADHPAIADLTHVFGVVADAWEARYAAIDAARLYVAEPTRERYAQLIEQTTIYVDERRATSFGDIEFDPTKVAPWIADVIEATSAIPEERELIGAVLNGLAAALRAEIELGGLR